ncbi:MAG TPA: glutamate-1-semialdehyde 2,1-aminomutase [Gammaproteobacteria bacterium]|jgi:glutamate-1-semialdehyde 2,1-aminomutase|nr:glutamate-1-semialdehyde 2,1-aminomutase [Gammaproteobacteria bacterium]
MSQSQALFTQAQKYMPAGVNSPVRAFFGVGGEPPYIQAGRGAYLTDVDGQEYVDYVCSWGPLIVGHAHPAVLVAVTDALQRGFSFGASTEIELRLAEKICQLMPTIEMLRFVNSGTEASMSAIRLARGYTKRDKILKFVGCYHGHADSLLVAAGSGALTFGVPSSAGVPASVAQHTLVADFNDLDAVTDLFAHHGDEIAAVIVEPIAANMNLVLPAPGFLAGLRALCDQYGSLLILDEVITGFRVGLGGAQAHFNVRPDLTILGKVIGGGFPAAAYGGRADIMRSIAPLGPVYQAGTLSGNPIAMTAGLATLALVTAPDFYTQLAAKTQQLIQGLLSIAKAANVPLHAVVVGSIFGLFFTDGQKITNEQDVKACDINRFKQFFHGMLREGIYLAPSAYEVGFVSAAHGDVEIEKTLKAAEKVFAFLRI